MTTTGEIEHYQDQIDKLLVAKNNRLQEVKEINSRLTQMGYGVKQVKTKKVVVAPKKTASTQKAGTPKKTVPTKKGQIKIVATLKNMKLFLISQGINFQSGAKKSELDKIIRQKCLVKKMNTFHEKH